MFVGEPHEFGADVATRTRTPELTRDRRTVELVRQPVRAQQDRIAGLEVVLEYLRLRKRAVATTEAVPQDVVQLRRLGHVAAQPGNLIGHGVIAGQLMQRAPLRCR
jgi:hypothetical protein